MRVLIVTNFLGEAYAHGLERVVMRLSAELERQGCEVAVATTWESPGPPGTSTGPERYRLGMRVFRVSAGELDPIGLPTEPVASERAVDQVLDQWPPDVVHVTLLHGLNPDVVAHIKRRGTPVVLDMHSHDSACARLTLRRTTGEVCAGPDGGRACMSTCFADLPEVEARIPERQLRFADAVRVADVRTACSPYLARFVSENCGVAEPRIVEPSIAAPDPGLPLAVRPTPASRGRLNLVMIGGVGRGKGTDFAVRAIASADLGPTQLALLGAVVDEPAHAALKGQAAAVDGLELRFVGAFDPDELSLLLSDVDILLLPTKSPETYSLAAREAWCRGIPVFASRLGALADAVREGENGFTFRHDEPGELGALLQRVVDEPDLLPALRKGAAQTPYATPADHAATFQRIYGEVVGAPVPATNSHHAPTAPVTIDGPRPEKRRQSDRASAHAGVFTDIYARDVWRLGGESSSGPGSRREHTERLRLELPRLVSRLGVRRLVDIGCGDYNWMRETDLDVELYIGIDVVFDVVVANRVRYGGPRRLFLLRDLTRDPLPRADLVLCRDVLIHFPDDDLVTAFDAIIRSGAHYLLASTFVERDRNEPIELGDWRPVNLELPPLSLPPPRGTIVETPMEPGYDDKRLALWDLRELRSRRNSRA